MKFLLTACALATVAWGCLAATPPPPEALDLAKRQAVLLDMLRLFPKSEPWEKWLQQSGELPPNFDKLPTRPGLPDPLQMLDGRDIKTVEQWPQRRLEILNMYRHFALGSVPQAPGNVRAAESKSIQEDGVMIHQITLEFGPEYKARLALELMVPKGQGPLPVFLTQPEHRRWAQLAVARGYIACIYAGSDARDDTTNYPALWPQCDWTQLTRRAWAAGRCIDYLATVPAVDMTRLAIAGHARNAKAALIAGVLDERLRAVVLSASGAAGASPYRLYSETQLGEGIELLSRTFPESVHPRLRFFAGRENKLPFDQPELIACLAPRACLITSALNDPAESIWANEQTFYAAQRVYSLFNASRSLGLLYRAGAQETNAEDIETCLDWLDYQMGRSNMPVGSNPIYPTYADWYNLSGERINPLSFPFGSLEGLLTTPGGNPVLKRDEWLLKRVEMRQRIAWGLGEPAAQVKSVMALEGEPVFMAALLNRLSVPRILSKRPVTFGNDLNGDLYYPADADQATNKLPAIVWLHPASNARGYGASYLRGEPPHLALANAGFTVLAFDQIGFGSRILEVRNFYRRNPRWSLLGKAVQDTSEAVSALRSVPFVDANRIFLVGYDLGAITALHAAALDERVAGVVSIAGFTPMRLNTTNSGTGGLARWSLWLPWQPRLAAFIGNESRTPYDYHEVLALIAPRPVLVVAPRLDYQCVPEHLHECLDNVAKVYAFLDVSNHLLILEPNDYNHLTPDLLRPVIESLKKMAGVPASAAPF